MEEMKQCPFCGGKPETWFSVESTSNNWAYARINCSKCNAKIEVRNRVDFNSKYNPGKSFIKLEEEVVEAWNKRIG